jgi:hypothetical protein
MTDEGDLRERAIASLKKKREFASHLLAFVLVNVFLVAIWAVTSDGTLFWPIFPILAWGIGLVSRVGRLWTPPERGADPPRDGTTRLTHHELDTRKAARTPFHAISMP